MRAVPLAPPRSVVPVPERALYLLCLLLLPTGHDLLLVVFISSSFRQLILPVPEERGRKIKQGGGAGGHCFPTLSDSLLLWDMQGFISAFWMSLPAQPPYPPYSASPARHSWPHRVPTCSQGPASFPDPSDWRQEAIKQLGQGLPDIQTSVRYLSLCHSAKS